MASFNNGHPNIGPSIGVSYRQTRRRRERQMNRAQYAVNVRLQQSPAASAAPSTAAANDNWAFLYDANALPGYASLPYNRYKHTTSMTSEFR